MARRTYRPEPIINKLRQAETLLSQEMTAGEAVRKIEASEYATAAGAENMVA